MSFPPKNVRIFSTGFILLDLPLSFVVIYLKEAIFFKEGSHGKKVAMGYSTNAMPGRGVPRRTFARMEGGEGAEGFTEHHLRQSAIVGL